MPHLSVDPMTAAANILLGLKHLVSHEVAAQETAVRHGGADPLRDEGQYHPRDGDDARHDPHVQRRRARQLKERLDAYAADIARAYRTEARVRFEGGATPTVVNHDARAPSCGSARRAWWARARSTAASS